MRVQYPPKVAQKRLPPAEWEGGNVWEGAPGLLDSCRGNGNVLAEVLTADPAKAADRHQLAETPGAFSCLDETRREDGGRT